MDGLIIGTEPLELIFAGKKCWEIRGNRTTKRGIIALIEKGSKTVVGTCEIVDVLGPLTLQELKRNARHVGVPAAYIEEYYPQTYAWVLRKAKRLKTPVPYIHKSQVIWVRLSSPVTKKIVSQTTNQK